MVQQYEKVGVLSARLVTLRKGPGQGQRPLPDVPANPGAATAAREAAIRTSERALAKAKVRCCVLTRSVTPW